MIELSVSTKFAFQKSNNFVVYCPFLEGTFASYLTFLTYGLLYFLKVPSG